MLESGDIVVPMVLGTPRLNKPPLIYWAQSAAASLPAQQLQAPVSPLPDAAAAGPRKSVSGAMSRALGFVGLGRLSR